MKFSILNNRTFTDSASGLYNTLSSHLLNWKSIKLVLIILITVNSIYDMIAVLANVNHVLKDVPLSTKVIKSLITILVIFLYKVAGLKMPKISSKIYHKVRFTYVASLAFLYLLYTYFDKKVEQISQFNINPSGDLRHTLLVQLVLDICCKFVVLDVYEANYMFKTLYVIPNIYLFSIVSRAADFSLYNLGSVTVIAFTLFAVHIAEERNRKTATKLDKYAFSRKIMGSLPDGILVYNPIGQVEYQNDYLNSIFNVAPKQIKKFVAPDFDHLYVKSPIVKLTRPNGQGNIDSLSNSNDAKVEEIILGKLGNVKTLNDFLSIVQDPQIWNNLKLYTVIFQTEYTCRTSPHEVVPMEIFINSFQVSKVIQALVLVFRDVSKREKIIALEKANEVYRNNLIATFSHELRTPLNGNLGFIQQALDSPNLPKDIRDELLLPALTSGKFLLSIVDDILDYSQIILNKLHLKMHSNSLSKVAEQCIELFKEKLSQKNLEMKLSIDSKTSDYVTTDHKRVMQILVNLISNAVKYTKQGSIAIKIKLTREQNTMISVIDTGLGMSKNTCENLQKNMVNGQIDNKVDDSCAGIGFGLYISNALARLLNPIKNTGIQFISTKDRGSEFYFEIENKKVLNRPFTEMEIDDLQELDYDEHIPIASYLLTPHSMSELNSCTRLDTVTSLSSKVLIVDDEVFNIMIIENFCKKLNIKTERAFDGKEALEKMKASSRSDSCQYKLILMDVNMPIMDGYQATKAIKTLQEEDEINKIPIVGVTAYIAQEMIDKCYKSGMDMVVNKPVSKETITNVLSRYNLV